MYRSDVLATVTPYEIGDRRLYSRVAIGLELEKVTDAATCNFGDTAYAFAPPQPFVNW